MLGPLLFIAYINDIADQVKLDIRLFADDCVCYRIIKDELDCVTLQEDINNLGKWARAWGMRFQPSKCNMIRFSRKRKNVENDYFLEGSELHFHSEVKYLGVTITSDLNWSKHVSLICNKAKKTLGLLKRNLSKCPKEVKLQAFKGLIRPTLEYASSAWDPHQSYLQNKIEQVQRRSVRFICGNYSHEPGTVTRMIDELKVPRLISRRRQNRLILMYKALSQKAVVDIHDLRPPIRMPRHSHTNHFRHLQCRTEAYKASFTPNTIRDWNALPASAFENRDITPEQVESFTNYVRSKVI